MLRKSESYVIHTLPTVTRLSEASIVVIWWYVSYWTAVFNGYLAYLYTNLYNVSKYLYTLCITLCLGNERSLRFYDHKPFLLAKMWVVSRIRHGSALIHVALSWYLWKKQHSIWLIPGIYYLHRRFRNSTKNVNCSKFYILNFEQNGEWNLDHSCK